MKGLLSILLLILSYSSIEALFGAPDRLSLLSDGDLKKLTPSHSQLDVSKLEPGNYLLSLARPRGKCGIWSGDRLVAANYSVSPQRASLTLSYPFVIDTSIISPKILDLKCIETEGFPSVLGVQPVVQKHALGMALHLWRVGIQIFFGPLTSLLGLSLLIFLALRYKEKYRGRARELLALFSIGTLYCVSLTHFFWLFFEPKTATLTHIVIRTLFIGSLVVFIPNRKRIYQYTAAVTFSLLLVLFLQGSRGSNDYLNFYNYELLFFGVFVSSIGVFLLRKRKDVAGRFLGASLLIYGLYHWSFFSSMAISLSGSFIGYLMPLSILVGFLYFEWKRSERSSLLETFRSSSDSILNSNETFEVKKALIKQSIENIVSAFYRLEKAELRSIKKMKNKLCHVETDQRSEVSVAVKKVRNQLATMRELHARRKSDLFNKKLESFYETNPQVFATVYIFDVNDYSKNCSIFGNPYAYFIKKSLTEIFDKELEQVAVVESIRGDEIVLVSLSSQDANQEQQKIPINFVLDTLLSRILPMVNESAEQGGFPPISISGGVASSACSIRKRETGMILESAPFSTARRLATGARANSILMDMETKRLLESSSTFREIKLLVKKDYIEAIEVSLVA